MYGVLFFSSLGVKNEQSLRSFFSFTWEECSTSTSLGATKTNKIFTRLLLDEDAVAFHAQLRTYMYQVIEKNAAVVQPH